MTRLERAEANGFDPSDDTLLQPSGDCPPEARAVIAYAVTEGHRLMQEQADAHAAEVAVALTRQQEAS